VFGVGALFGRESCNSLYPLSSFTYFTSLGPKSAAEKAFTFFVFFIFLFFLRKGNRNFR